MNASGSRCHRSARRGFTLLEVLLVLAILGVIAALVVPRMVGRQKQANIDATKLSIKGLEQALKLYALDHSGEYPTTNQGLESLRFPPTNGDRRWKGPYLEMAPVDAWGNSFHYVCPGEHHPESFDISSPGTDGIPNTEDDITNWSVAY